MGKVQQWILLTWFDNFDCDSEISRLPSCLISHMDQIEGLCPESCNYIDIGIGVAQYYVLNITKFVY